MPTKWLTEEKSLRLIKLAVYGRLATCSDDHQPYITPVNFVLIEKRIYFHCGLAGRKIDNLKSNPRICFEVSRHGKLYAAPRALNFTMRYWSVLAFGRAIQINDPEKHASKSEPKGSAPPATMAATKMDKKAIKTLTGRESKKKPRHFNDNRGITNSCD